MASYQVAARNQEGTPVVLVSIGSIDQDTHMVDDLTVVDAVRECLAAVPGVVSVVAQKFEQVITIV
ncbi:hypothetical protein [Streptomyces sp. NPDC051016]|uniref:hypothetical protein n=1 Tax=Streptomyces sp. NPDC051016 TaxID=3365638 RepID=UPI0037952D88